jgi:hypothetical protein
MVGGVEKKPTIFAQKEINESERWVSKKQWQPLNEGLQAHVWCSCALKDPIKLADTTHY